MWRKFEVVSWAEVRLEDILQISWSTLGRKKVEKKKVCWTSHLLLLVMVVVVRRLVRRCREVVRSIALVVHHIQATHSDGPERLMRRRKSEERSAHNTAEGRLSTPDTSDGLYPPSHRCLHICPNAYNGHVVQFAYGQCASRCALHQHHPGPQNGSKTVWDKHTVS